MTAIAHFGITVGDLDRSIAFYRDVLGFGVGPTIERPGDYAERLTGVSGARLAIVAVSSPGASVFLELVQYLDGAGTRAKTRPCDSGTAHVCFTTDRFDETTAALETAGVPFLGEVCRIPAGPRAGKRVVYLRDPDDVVLELVEG
jgi:catechol 2,3-dioxygenase-like lactoylglutathione lyase family enzyme